MKYSGSVRTVDATHRVVVPSDICDALEIGTGDAVEFLLSDGEIILRKYEPGCTFCGSVRGCVLFDGKHICKKCLRAIKEL